MITELEKNKAEKLRIELTEFKGYRLLNMRIYWRDPLGEWKPGKQGLAWRVERLPELRQAIEEAEAEARRQGLLEGADG